MFRNSTGMAALLTPRSLHDCPRNGLAATELWKAETVLPIALLALLSLSYLHGHCLSEAALISPQLLGSSGIVAKPDLAEGLPLNEPLAETIGRK